MVYFMMLYIIYDNELRSVQAEQQLGYRLANTEFEFGQSEKMVFYSKTFRLALGLSLLFNGYWSPSNKVKEPEREVDHSFPPSSEFKNEWS
jgi:hypothetical protein